MKTPAEIERAAEELKRAQEKSIPETTKILIEKSNNPLKPVSAPVAKETTPAPVVQKRIHAEDNESNKIIQAYKDKYTRAKWYKEPEENKDGHFTLYFEDEKTATEFSEAQAKAGHKFIMIDEKGKVKGYSDGKNFIENTENKCLQDIKRELGGQNNRPGIR